MKRCTASPKRSQRSPSISAAAAKPRSRASSRKSTSRSEPARSPSSSRELGAGIPLLGEFVIVVAGDSSDAAPDEARAREIYDLLSAELDPTKALQLTAALTGLPRNALYRLTRT